MNFFTRALHNIYIFRNIRNKGGAVDSILAWASEFVGEKDVIAIDSPELTGMFSFSYPIKYKDFPERVPSEKNIQPTLCIHMPPKIKRDNHEWIQIFSSPHLEIIEKRDRLKKINPVRWGLSSEEKKHLVELARNAIRAQLGIDKTPRAYTNHNEKLERRGIVCVALWAHGRIRGSSLIEHRSLTQGIKEAAIGATSDRRFLPITTEDLQACRIEVTIIRDPEIPLSLLEKNINAIYPEKGYLITHKKTRGWLLPEVFNVRQFADLNNFLTILGKEKAGISTSLLKYARVTMHEIDDFIESSEHNRIITLRGPTPAPMPFTEEEADYRFRNAADWLCQIQEPNGNIPTIINPITGTVQKKDAARLAFIALALAEFGNATREKKYIAVARKCFEYAKNDIFSKSHLNTAHRHTLCLVYLGQLAEYFKAREISLAVAQKTASQIHEMQPSIIEQAQIATFLGNTATIHTEFEGVWKKLLATLKSTYETMHDKDNTNPAEIAELTNTFISTDNNFSMTVNNWLKKQQRPDGAIPISKHSAHFAYTRGVGKIFEVLALRPAENKTEIYKMLQWLFSMQYNEDSLYHVPIKNWDMIRGGFRHDPLNPDVWIDAAGHIILGAARLINSAGTLAPHNNGL